MISEVFLVIEDAHRRLAELGRRLLPLSHSPERPRCLWVRGYCHDGGGTALVHLCYPSLAAHQAKWLTTVAETAEVMVLLPAQMSPAERERLYESLIGRFERKVGPYRSVEAGVSALHKVLRRRRVGSPAAQPESATRVMRGSRRGSSPAVAYGPRAARASSSPVRPSTRGETEVDSPHAAPLSGASGAHAQRIEVRFRRGDEWVAGRVRQVGAKTAYLATSTPPRLRDLVHLVFQFAEHRVVVCGVVTRRSPAVNCSDLGFGVTYFDVADAERRLLFALLRAAREAGVSLSPPPHRAAARFPVRLPIRVTSPGGILSLPALDISTSGFFIASARAKLGSELSFLMPYDSGGDPIRGHADVARTVGPKMARRRGLIEGAGIRIATLERGDRARLDALIDRVRERSSKYVVVLAEERRGRRLALAFRSLGYAVTAAPTIDSLHLAASSDAPRQPDLAIFDASLERSLDAVHMERRWRRGGVLCLVTSDQSPQSVRTTADRALGILPA